MPKQIYSRIDGKDVYAHEDASIAYRRLFGPTVSFDEEQQTSGIRIALTLLALCGTLGAIGWLFTIT